MTKIISIKQPEKIKKGFKPPLNELQRFVWWKRHYYSSLSIIISLLIVPIFAWRRGNIILGIRMSIIFYLVTIMFLTLTRVRTEKKDNEYLESKGYSTEKKIRWYSKPLKFLFTGLRLYVLYLMYEVWVMTLG